MTLAAKVEAVNEVNRLSFSVHQTLNNILQPHIGKKIVKITPYHSFVKKLKDEIDENLTDVRVIFHFYGSTISAEITQIYAVTDERYDRVKKYIYFAKIDGDILTELLEPKQEEEEEYKLEEVEAAFNRLRELEDEKLNIRRSIGQFI